MSIPYRIQYASNLFVHQNSNLTQAKKLIEPRHASNLALLGNIGFPSNSKTKDFIRWCSDHWLTVYWVPGPTELLQNHQVDSLKNDYDAIRNLTILDHKEDSLHDFPLKVIGAPLWIPWGHLYSPQVSEKQTYFLANKSWKTAADWHLEDSEFIETKVTDNSLYLVLTHHLPSHHLLSSGPININDVLFFSNGKLYNYPNIVGILSGAGYTTNQGFFGSHKTFCAVNPAFKSPDMVPNPSYKPHMVATFNLGNNSKKPNGYGIAYDYIKRFYPVPSVAYQLQ